MFEKVVARLHCRFRKLAAAGIRLKTYVLRRCIRCMLSGDRLIALRLPQHVFSSSVTAKGRPEAIR